MARALCLARFLDEGSRLARFLDEGSRQDDLQLLPN